MFKAHYGLLANCPPPINFQSQFAQPKYTLPPCYCNHPPAPTPYKSHSAVYNPRPYNKQYNTDCYQKFGNKKDDESFLTENELDMILERALEGYDAANKPASSAQATANLSVSNGYQNYQCPSSNTLQGDNATLAVAMAPNVSLKINQREGKDRKKPRKQPNPRKSADFEDPNFQGVVISMHAKLEGTESKLTIYSSFRYDYVIHYNKITMRDELYTRININVLSFLKNYVF